MLLHITYPEKFIRDSVIAPFFLLSVVIFAVPRHGRVSTPGIQARIQTQRKWVFRRNEDQAKNNNHNKL